MKTTTSITIDPEVLDSFKELCHETNVSGWIERKMKEEIENTQTSFKCADCSMPACPSSAWRVWKWKCPNCGNTDRQKIILADNK